MRLRLYTIALATIPMFLAGCSSGTSSSTSSPAPVQAATSYSNATVTGHYATALHGMLPITDGSMDYYSILANLVSTGGGQFTGTYTAQFFNFHPGASQDFSPSPCSGSISGGTYSIGSTGDGTASLTFSPTLVSTSCPSLPATYQLSTNASGEEIVFAEQDGSGTSSGAGIVQQ